MLHFLFNKGIKMPLKQMKNRESHPPKKRYREEPNVNYRT